MQPVYVTLADEPRPCEAVVVVDVLRAFTFAALALDGGARELRCVASVEEVLAAKRAGPEVLAVGEVDGRRVAGFDLGNSPTALVDTEVADRVLVQRTSAGTQGLVRWAERAQHAFAAAFVTASAAADAIRDLAPRRVTFVLTGVDERDGDEDRACAEYIAALVSRPETPADAYRARVATSDAAQFLRRDDADQPLSDVAIAMEVDRVDLAVAAQATRDHTILRSARRTP